MGRVFIIAEAGVNHNGSLDLACRLVDAAGGAGADAVKFQTFKAERLVSGYAPKADYQRKRTEKSEGQLEMLKRLELSRADHEVLIKRCAEKKILFLSTPFDLESIDMLEDLGLRIFKIPSGEITNLAYLRKVGALKKKIIMSTGMADTGEIRRALSILRLSGALKRDITILHCNSAYPTPMKDVNLKAMLSLKNVFNLSVGYSDHTAGIEVPVAAAALGADVIEKHFTLDRKMTGPDHGASLEPEELRAMVKAIRNIERAMGSGIKRPSPSELKNRPVARKSIVADREIKKGEIFSSMNITVKRPGHGIDPMEWDRVLGKRARRRFCADELIEL